MAAVFFYSSCWKMYKAENIYVIFKIESKEHIYKAQIFPRTRASYVRNRHIQQIKFLELPRRNEIFAVIIMRSPKARVQQERQGASPQPSAKQQSAAPVMFTRSLGCFTGSFPAKAPLIGWRGIRSVSVPTFSSLTSQLTSCLNFLSFTPTLNH